MRRDLGSSQFGLEELEPRVLLSANAVVFGAASAASTGGHHPSAIHELGPTDTSHNSLSYNPASQLEDMLAGVEQAGRTTAALASQTTDGNATTAGQESAVLQSQATSSFRTTVTTRGSSGPTLAKALQNTSTALQTTSVNNNATTVSQLTLTLKSANGPPLTGGSTSQGSTRNSGGSLRPVPNITQAGAVLTLDQADTGPITLSLVDDNHNGITDIQVSGAADPSQDKIYDDVQSIVGNGTAGVVLVASPLTLTFSGPSSGQFSTPAFALPVGFIAIPNLTIRASATATALSFNITLPDGGNMAQFKWDNTTNPNDGLFDLVSATPNPLFPNTIIALPPSLPTNLTINLGGGGDTLSVGPVMPLWGQNSTVTINGGAGDDTVTFDGLDNEYASYVFDGGGGDNKVNIGHSIGIGPDQTTFGVDTKGDFTIKNTDTFNSDKEATLNASHISITTQGDINLGDVDAPVGGVSLSSANGNISFKGLVDVTDGGITIASGKGVTFGAGIQIEDPNESPVNINVSGDVQFLGRVVTPGPFQTTTSGNITVGDELVAGGGVDLEAGGNLNIEQPIITTGSAILLKTGGSLTTTSSAQLISNQTAHNAGNITLISTGSGDILLGGTLRADGNDGGNGGNISIQNPGAQIMLADISCRGAALASGGSPGADGTVELVGSNAANGGITQTAGSGISAGNLKIISGSDVDLANVQNDVNVLAAEVTGGHNFQFTNAGDLIVGQIPADASLNIDAQSGVLVQGVDGSITLRANDGALNVNSQVSAAGAGSVTIQTGGTSHDINVNAAISSGTGNVTLIASGAVVPANPANVTTTAPGGPMIVSGGQLQVGTSVLVTVTGKVEYEDWLFNQDGYLIDQNGTAPPTRPMPVRQAEVQLFDGSGNPIQDSSGANLVTYTSDDGTYQFQNIVLTVGTKLTIQVLAEAQGVGAVRHAVVIPDPDPKAPPNTYVVNFDSPGEVWVFKPTATASVVGSATCVINAQITDRNMAAPWNILDMMVLAHDVVSNYSAELNAAQLPNLAKLNNLIAIWGNPSGYSTPTQSAISSSGDYEIVIADGPAKAEDDYAILHEYGHIVEVTFGLESPGSFFHAFNDPIVDDSGTARPDVAFNEGFAYFFALVVADQDMAAHQANAATPERVSKVDYNPAHDPIVEADFLQGNLFYFPNANADPNADSNFPSVSIKMGLFAQFHLSNVDNAVAAVLWDIYDNTPGIADLYNTGDKVQNLRRIFTIANRDLAGSTPTIQDFYTAWVNDYGTQGPGANTVLPIFQWNLGGDIPGPVTYSYQNYAYAFSGGTGDVIAGFGDAYNGALFTLDTNSITVKGSTANAAFTLEPSADNATYPGWELVEKSPNGSNDPNADLGTLRFTDPTASFSGNTLTFRGAFYFIPFISNNVGAGRILWTGQINAAITIVTQKSNIRIQVNPGFTLGNGGLPMAGSVGAGGVNNWLDVSRVQQRLRYLGFPSDDGNQLAVDGLAGPKTIEAISRFERAINDLISGVPDGRVDTNFLARAWLVDINAPHWVSLDGAFPVGGNVTVAQSGMFGSDWLVMTLADADAALSQGVVIQGVDPSGMGVDIQSANTDEPSVLSEMLAIYNVRSPQNVGFKQFIVPSQQLADDFNAATKPSLAIVNSGFAAGYFHVDFLAPHLSDLSLENASPALINFANQVTNAQAAVTNSVTGIPIAGLPSTLNLLNLTHASPGPDIGEFLNFGQAITNYFNDVTTRGEQPTYLGLAGYIQDYLLNLWHFTEADNLNGQLVSVTGGFDATAQQIQFNIVANMGVTKQTSLDLGSLGAALGLKLTDSVPLTMTVGLHMDVSFGLNMSGFLQGNALSPSDGFFRVNAFTVNAQVAASGLSFDFSCGPFQAGVQGASMVLSLQADIALRNPMAPSGKITWADLANGNLAAQLTPIGSLSIFLPLSLNVASVGTANARITITESNIFSPAPPAITADGSVTFYDLTLGSVFDVKNATFTFLDNGQTLGFNATSASLNLGAGAIVLNMLPGTGPGADGYAVEGTYATATGAYQFSAANASLAIANFVTLSGAFGVQKASGDTAPLLVAAQHVTAQLNVGVALQVGVGDGTLAMILNQDGTMAFEASGAPSLALGGGFVSVSATSATVNYNTTTTNYTGQSVTVGNITAPLDVPASSTPSPFESVVVKGLSASIGGFVSLGGDFAFQEQANNLQVVSAGAFAKLALGPSIEAGLTNGTLALVLQSDGTMALQASGSASIVLGSGLGSISADSVTVKYNNTTTDYTGQSVTVGGVTAPLDVPVGTPSPFESVVATNFQAQLADFVTLQGDFGFASTGTELDVVASVATAELEVGSFKAGVEGGTLALIVKDDGTEAFEVSGNPTLALGGGFASVSATSCLVEYNTTGTAYGPTLTVGNITAPLDIPANSTPNPLESVVVKGVSASIGGFVSLGGDFAFQEQGNNLQVVSTGAFAELALGPSLEAGLTNGTLALVLQSDSTMALQASGSASIVLGSGLGSISADSVTVKYNNTGTAYTGLSVTVGGITAPLDVPVGTPSPFESVVATNFQAQLANFVSLQGDFGFASTGTELDVVASGASALLTVGSVQAGVTGGSLALIIKDDGTEAFEVSGAPSLALGSGLTATALSAQVQYNNTGTEVKGPVLVGGVPSISIGGVQAPLDVPAGTPSAFESVVVKGLSVSIGGFVSLGGDFAFQEQGDNLQVVSTGAFAKLELGPSIEAGLTNGTLALVLQSDGTMALQASGSASIVLGDDFASISADSVTVKYNNTTTDYTGQTVTVGGITAPLDVPAGSTPNPFESVVATNFQAQLANFISLKGDFSFSEATSGDPRILVSASDLTATLGNQTLSAQIDGASFGLVIYPGLSGASSTYALHADAPSITVNGLPPDTTLTGAASVDINTTGKAVNEPSVGVLFTDGTNSTPDQRNIKTFGGHLTFSVAGISLSGDFSFTETDTGATSEILVGAANVTASALTPTLGGSSSVGLSNGSLGLVLFGADQGYALTASGTATASLGSLSATATVTVRRNTTTSPQDVTILVGTSNVVVNFSGDEVATLSGAFQAIVLSNINLNLDNTLIITAPQDTSNSLPGYPNSSTYALTSPTLTLEPDGSNVLLTITAGSATYTTFGDTVPGNTIPGLPNRSDGASWQPGDKDLFLNHVSFSLGSFATFTATSIDVQHYSTDGGATYVNKFIFSGTTVTFLANGKPMVSLSGSAVFHFSAIDGFEFDSFSVTGVSFLDPTPSLGPISLPSSLNNHNDSNGLNVGLSNFQYNLVSPAQPGKLLVNLSAIVTIGAGKASIGTGSVYASLSNIQGSFTVSANLDLLHPTDLSGVSLNDFSIMAGEVDVFLGPDVKLKATSVAINPTAGPTQDLISFGLLGATVNIGSVSLSGSASNFAIEGNGSFVEKSNFTILVSLSSGDSNGFNWPSWLPFQISDVAISWPDFSNHPDHFQLKLSGSLDATIGPLTLNGSVTNAVFDSDLFLLGKFPFVSVDSISGGVSGQLFGDSVGGIQFVAGVVRFDANGAIVDSSGNLQGTNTPGQGPFNSAFYFGIAGGISLAGLGEIQFRFGMSDVGPLTIYLDFSGTPGIPLGDSGLFITGLRGGVDFGVDLPQITIHKNPSNPADALQLRQSAFNPTSSLTLADWQAQLAGQVANQYATWLSTHPNPTGPPTPDWSDLLKSKATITAGVTISAGDPDVFRVDADVKIDTTGKLLVIGTATIGDSLSLDAKLYFDPSQSGVLFLLEMPAQTVPNPITKPILSLYGTIVVTNGASLNGLQIAIAGAADLDVLGGLEAHTEATLTLTFTSSSFNITLSNASFSVGTSPSNSILLGVAAGTLTIQKDGDSADIWGAFVLTVSAQDLVPLTNAGITFGGQLFVQLNTTSVLKQVTLQLHPGSQQLTLQPETFSLLISSTADFKVSGAEMFQLTGTLALDMTPDHLAMFVDGSLLLGGGGSSTILTFNANGLIYIPMNNFVPTGFAAKLSLTVGLSVPNGISLGMKWLLVMNTTSADITYIIPAPLPTSPPTPPIPIVTGPDYSSSDPLALTSYETTVTVNGQPQRALFIPSGPPAAGLTNYATWTPAPPNTPYFIILGRGSITLLNTFKLTGAINIAVSSGAFTLQVNATLAVLLNGNPVLSYQALGGLQLGRAGVAAVFSVTYSAGFSGFSLTAGYSLQLNTTSQAVTLSGITLPAGMARIHAAGDLSFLNGVVDINGVFDLTISGSHLSMAINAQMTFFGSTFTVNGAAALYYDSNPGLVLAVQLGLPGGEGISPFPGFVITGSFTLQINTCSVQRQVGTTILPADYFQVAVSNLGINLFGFNLDGSLSIAIGPNGFTIPSLSLHLGFFGFCDLYFNGYYNGSNNFSITAQSSFSIGLDHVASASVALSVTFSNSGFSATVSGTASLDFLSESISATLTITGDAVQLTVSAKHIGSITITLGHTSPPPPVAPSLPPPVPSPPPLAGVNANGVLVLYLGADVGNRGADAGPQTAENYSLTRVSGDPDSTSGEEIQVTALGATETFNNVTSILVSNTLGGNDTIQVDNAIAVPVNMTLGSGSNTISTGSGPATISVTGDGTNYITTRNNATITVSGNGSNHIAAGSGSGVNITGNGNNGVSINGGSGAITISGTGNNSVAVAGGYSGTITITSAAGGSNAIDATGGSPTINFNGNGNDEATVTTDSAETFNVNGNGNDEINAFGSGNATITVNGNGANQIHVGSRATIYLRGSGNESVLAGSGFVTIYDQGSGADMIESISGGGVYVGGLNANGLPYSAKGNTSIEDHSGKLSIQMLGYSSYTLTDPALTYGSFSLSLSGVLNATLSAYSSAVANQFSLNGWSGSATLQGAGNNNTLLYVPAAALSSLNYALTNSSLKVTGGLTQTIQLSDIQTANLVGASAGTNSYNVSGWTGGASLTGPAGTYNTVVALNVGLNDVNFTLSDTALSRSGLTSLPTISLAGIQNAFLVGGPSSNTFNIANWSGNVTLDGAGSSDTYNLTLTGLGTGYFQVADSGPAPGDTVNIYAGSNSLTTSTQVNVGTQRVTYLGIAILNVIGTASGLTYNLQSTKASVITSIRSTGSSNVINVGSTAGVSPVAPGVVNNIAGALTVIGAGQDTLNVDDTGSSAANVGTLTPTALTGLGMGINGIHYQGLSALNINLGPGGNTFYIADINPATHTAVNGGSSNNDTVTATFAADFNGRLDLVAFEHGTVTVTGNFNGTMTDTAPGHLESVQIGQSLTASGSLMAGNIDTMNVSQNLAGTVLVSGTLTSLTVGNDVSGSVTESGTLNLLTIGGSLTSTGTITAVNPTPTLGNINTMTVGGSLAGVVLVSGTLGTLKVKGDVSGSVTESGTINLLTIGGSLTATGVITAANTADPAQVPGSTLGNINTFSVGSNLAGNVTVTGNVGSLTVGGSLSGKVAVHNTLTTLNVTGDVSGSVTESGTVNTLTIGGSFTQTGIIKAVNTVLPNLGNVNTMSVGQDFAGTLIVSGTLGSLAIVNGSMTPTASISAGAIGTMTIGPDYLKVGQNMAGQITVTGTFQSLRVAGGTPGSITVGHMGTIACYGGYGPVVLQITENGVQRRVEAANPSQPYPLPNPYALATSPQQPNYINFQYFYESGSLPNPQLTVRVTNNVSTARDQFDLSLVVYSDVAKFSLARLDASGVSGIRNVDVEGDLLTSVSAQAASFFKLVWPSSNPVLDTTPAGIHLPSDNLAGAGIRDYAPNGYIQVHSIQVLAFGSYTGPNGVVATGAMANSSIPLALLAPGTAIVQAADTFRVPFADLPSQQVALFLDTAASGGTFDSHSVVLTVEGVLSPNSTGTANVITPSNAARGAVTALVTAMPPASGLASVIQTIAFRGDGASIQTQQWISNSITSTGQLGDLNLLSSQGITNVTAPSIFGSIVSGGMITGTIQTTGVRIDPITSASSSVAGNFGNVYVAFSKGVPYLTTTVVQAQGGGISGRIISRGNLLSLVSSSGGLTGVIAVQGNLGAIWTISKTTTRLGGIVSSNGAAISGSIVVLGQQLGDVSLNGTLSGSYAAKGGIVGNLSIGGGLGATGNVISGGEIGDSVQGTSFTFTGTNSGIIAAEGSIHFTKGTPAGYVFSNAAGANAAAINAIFTNNGLPLALDIGNLDLQGLTLILTDLQNLKVGPNGVLTGPIS